MTENTMAWGVFLSCQTQWQRAGMDGMPTGLNYVGVESVMRIHGIAPDEQEDCFSRVRILESEALTWMHDDYARKNQAAKTKGKNRRG